VCARTLCVCVGNRVSGVVTRRTLLVSGKDEEVDAAMGLGIGKRLKLIGVRVVPYGVIRIHSLGVVGQYT
jgi:hypothetical protein